MNQVFPSLAHQTSLQETPYSALNEQYRREYHAYIYAWRRKYLYDRNKSSNLDPQGKYYDARMIDLVSRVLYPSRQPKQQISPAEQEADRGELDRAARFSAQDRDRAAAMAKITGDGRNPDGSWSAESLAFSTLCMQQVNANFAEFPTKQRLPSVPNDPDALSRLATNLGVRVTERHNT